MFNKDKDQGMVQASKYASTIADSAEKVEREIGRVEALNSILKDYDGLAITVTIKATKPRTNTEVTLNLNEHEKERFLDVVKVAINGRTSAIEWFHEKFIRIHQILQGKD